jgi:hypothetical protein
VPVLSETQLAERIRSTLVPDGRCAEEDVGPLARTVLLYFRGGTEVIDSKLSSDDRGRFYALEDAGILMCQTEEAHLGRGRTWRIHYWSFRSAADGS